MKSSLRVLRHPNPCLMVIGLSLAVLLLFSGDALATVDAVSLDRAFTNQSESLRSLARTGIKFAGWLCMLVSLGFVGWKLANKDPSAIWHLVGVVAAGAMFALAAAL